jgi:alpha/beta superfamily hydrolase
MEQKKKVSLGQRWDEFQPTKTVLIWSMVAAVILTMIVGFTWGGWVTAGTAQETAEEAVVERLALICVDQFKQDPETAQKFIEFVETRSYQQDDDRNVADACAKLIALIDQ